MPRLSRPVGASRHRTGTDTCAGACFDHGVLTNDAAEALADELDLDAIPASPLCLLELAVMIRAGRRPHPSTVQRVAWMTWEEIETELRDQVVELRMREVMHAEEALTELDEKRYRGRLARVVVRRLAETMAAEIASRELE